MAFIDYNKYNFCAGCELTFLKNEGTKCPQRHHQARTIPRNPKIFRGNKVECSYSEIWMTSGRLKNTI